jgi:pimeloyl-ACP methyl ester carboxylesterase
MRPIAVILLLTPPALPALFDYDAKQPFDATCEEIGSRKDADVRGCGFSGPKGGRVNFIQVSPKGLKPPFAGAIFQHGGGQSMTNYLSEALILARVGVVSLIPDAPARGNGKNTEINTMKLEEARDFEAETVIIERRVLDLLLQQPGVDPKRVAYIGHSYGGIAGGVLAGIEPRIATFVLIGAVPSFAKHMEENGSPYWQDMRKSMSAADFARTMDLIRETDPSHFLPAARAPILVQCARLDADDNVRGCPEVHRLAGGPKQIVWYDDDHNFTLLEEMRDRLQWLEKNLKLIPVGPQIKKFLKL